MTTTDFRTTLLVSRTPGEVFDNILNVRGWWSGLYSEEIKGRTNKLNDEFTFRAGEGAHYSKQKLIELVPGEKVVWLVTDSKLTFIQNTNEWEGTRLCFEISKKHDKTEIRFTHLGLLPEIECYDSCSTAWTQYMQEKLLGLITHRNVSPVNT